MSRSSDRRESSDPTKAAALGLTTGPAVGGEENLSAEDPQNIAEALLPSYGWSSSEMSCLVPLWEGESGWRVNAENTSSGAYGIPQSLPGSKMATAGADWRTNAGHPDPVGPGLHPGALRLALRRVGLQAGQRLVLRARPGSPIDYGSD